MNKYYYTIVPNDDYNVYLAHHGIKGQKWGVRRYQNADGSLTKAGQARYSVNTAYAATKSLNKIEKQNAKLITKQATAELKANKARNKANKKKFDKYTDISKQAGEAIKAGQELQKKIISDATKKGYTVNSIDSLRYTHVGKQIAASMLFGPIGNVVVSGIDIYRVKNYSSETGGIVTGKKYNVNSKEF